MNTILNTVVLNNSIQNYLIFLILLLTLFFIIKFFKERLITKLISFFKKTDNKLDDTLINIVKNISDLFFWFIAFFISSKTLSFPGFFNILLDKTLIIFITYELLKASREIIDYTQNKLSSGKDTSVQTAYKAISKFIKWGLWIVAILFILSNFGVNITAFAATLGIGGIAIAFAFKEILKDLFSYFVILLDKPIEVGDYIVLGNKKGKVKNIGIKTTRLEAIDGEEVILSNQSITDSDLENFGKTEKRRVSIEIGVAYDTPLVKLKKIKVKIQKIIESFGDNEFDRCHLKTLGESSMNFDTVYYIKTRDYYLYMDTTEKVNFEILKYFEKNKIEIPFPTRTVYNK